MTVNIGLVSTKIRETLIELSSIESNDIELDISFKHLEEALYEIEAVNYLRHDQGVPDDEQPDRNARIPFDTDTVFYLPVDTNGHVIPSIPEITDREYDHDGKPYAKGPAFFADPETKIVVYTRDKGWEEGVMIKDLDWTQVKCYKKFHQLDDSIEEFGLF